MTQVKIKKTETIKDSQKGDVIVAKGKLVLIEKPYNNELNTIVKCRCNNGTTNVTFSFVKEIYNVPLGKAFNTLKGDKTYHGADFVGNILNKITPIIISETEEIEKGDKRAYSNPYYKGEWEIVENEFPYSEGDSEYCKILALPEHFSPKQLQAIVDGKMKDGDEVYLECNTSEDNMDSYVSMFGGEEVGNTIKLNQNNHITLHKVEESWDDIREKAYEEWKETFGATNFSNWYINWLAKKYNPPTKKQKH